MDTKRSPAGRMSGSPARFLPLLCLAATLRTSSGQNFWQDSFRLDFSYDALARNGPDNWQNVDVSSSEWDRYISGGAFNLDILGNECGVNNPQPSPISLFQNKPCRDTHEILTRQITATDCGRETLSFEITPFALRAYYPHQSSNCARPTIEMSNIPDPFVLVWMEVHARAEHVVDGKRFDAELQLVHLGTGSSTNRMAIISILVDANGREENAEFQWLLDQWQTTFNEEEGICQPSMNETSVRRELQQQKARGAVGKMSEMEKRILQEEKERLLQQGNCKPDRFGRGCEPFGPRQKMFPYNLMPSIWYFSYDGSITTPPCSPIVGWRVINEPMLISTRQFKQLAQLQRSSRDQSCQSDSAVSSRGENFRPLQTMTATQEVHHCRYEDFSFAVYLPEDQ